MTLRDYLNKHGMTATSLAAQIGVAHSTVLRWADGSSFPGPHHLMALCGATDGNVTPNDFFLLTTTQPSAAAPPDAGRGAPHITES